MSRQQAKDVLQETNRCLGFKIPMVPFESSYTRFQLFSNADVVYGFGLLDKDRRHLYGSQGVMIQASLLLDKKTYVYDEHKKQWYVARIYKQKNKKGEWKVWHRFVSCKRPHGFLSSVSFYDPSTTSQETLNLMDAIQHL